jgi:hypothetical protein
VYEGRENASGYTNVDDLLSRIHLAEFTKLKCAALSHIGDTKRHITIIIHITKQTFGAACNAQTNR